jgi:hypothetical protein
LFAELATEYEALSPEAKARYSMFGSLGTAVHAQGGVAFGLVERELMRTAGRDSRQQRLEDILAGSGGIVALRESLDLQTVKSRRELIGMAKADRLLLRHAAVMKDDLAASLLLEYNATQGESARARLAAQFPSLSLDESGLFAQYCGGVAACLDWTCPLVETIPKKLAAMKEHTQASELFKKLEEDFESRCKFSFATITRCPWSQNQQVNLGIKTRVTMPECVFAARWATRGLLQGKR